MNVSLKQRAMEFLRKTDNEFIEYLSSIIVQIGKNQFDHEMDYIMKYYLDEGVLKIIGWKEPQKIFLFRFTTMGKKVVEINNRRANYTVTHNVGLPNDIRRPKKGKPGKYDGNTERFTKYPYELMIDPGWSFHVPDRYENQKPAERIGPSVAAINNHYRDKDGQLTRRFIWRKVDERDPEGHGVRVWRVQ